VTAADTTQRRIERELHDGAQQRLVPPGADDPIAQLDGVATELGRGSREDGLAPGDPDQVGDRDVDFQAAYLATIPRLVRTLWFVVHDHPQHRTSPRTRSSSRGFATSTGPKPPRSRRDGSEANSGPKGRHHAQRTSLRVIRRSNAAGIKASGG
jgi:hypothetical protein